AVPGEAVADEDEARDRDAREEDEVREKDTPPRKASGKGSGREPDDAEPDTAPAAAGDGAADDGAAKNSDAEDGAAKEGAAEESDAAGREGKARRGRRRRPAKPAGGTVRQGELIRALTALRERLGSFDLLLDVPGVQEAREARDELRAQLEDYVLPRIQAAGKPMLVVLGGSTGAGKSTLVNTLVGARVSATGVLRPTTSSPILVCHPDHVDWFMEGPLLPGMGRVRGPAPDAIAGDQLVIIGSDVLPPGLALLDSPDFDSVFEDHYEFATKLMAAA